MAVPWKPITSFWILHCLFVRLGSSLPQSSSPETKSLNPSPPLPPLVQTSNISILANITELNSTTSRLLGFVPWPPVDAWPFRQTVRPPPSSAQPNAEFSLAFRNPGPLIDAATYSTIAEALRDFADRPIPQGPWPRSVHHVNAHMAIAGVFHDAPQPWFDAEVIAKDLQRSFGIFLDDPGFWHWRLPRNLAFDALYRNDLNRHIWYPVGSFTLRFHRRVPT